jgi:hypothetical protein
MHLNAEHNIESQDNQCPKRRMVLHSLCNNIVTRLSMYVCMYVCMYVLVCVVLMDCHTLELLSADIKHQYNAGVRVRWG